MRKTKEIQNTLLPRFAAPITTEKSSEPNFMVQWTKRSMAAVTVRYPITIEILLRLNLCHATAGGWRPE